MPEREGPPPDNIIKFDPNEAFKKRLEKTGELDEIQRRAGAEMGYYQARRAEGKETKGKWTISIVDTSTGDIRQLVGRKAGGRFEMMPNDVEHMRQEHVFATDREADAALEQLQKQFSEITGNLEFRVFCGGIDEEQDDDEPKLRIVKPDDQE